MKFRCERCKWLHEIDNESRNKDRTIYVWPWYLDEKKREHFLIACLKCGAIHDTTDSLSTRLLTGLSRGVKVHNCSTFIDFISLFKTQMFLGSSEDCGQGAKNFRSFLTEDIGIPEVLIEELIERKIPMALYAFQNDD